VLGANTFSPCVSDDEYFACQRRVTELFQEHDPYPEFSLEEAAREYRNLKRSGNKKEAILAYIVLTEIMAYMIEPKFTTHRRRVMIIRLLMEEPYEE
jgi:hypothetical protein